LNKVTGVFDRGSLPRVAADGQRLFEPTVDPVLRHYTAAWVSPRGRV